MDLGRAGIVVQGVGGGFAWGGVGGGFGGEGLGEWSE